MFFLMDHYVIFAITILMKIKERLEYERNDHEPKDFGISCRT